MENSKMERMERFGNLEEKMHMKLMLFEEERNQDAYMLSLQDKQMRKRLDNLQICIEKTMELEKAWEKQRLDHRTQQRWHLAQKLLHAQLAQQVKRRNAAKRIFSAMRKQKLLLQKCTETNVLLLHKKSEKLRQKMKNNAIETGKHLQTLDERKAEMAEIAKDWGFKQEKTALQFIRALENTRRRAQAPKPPIPDSQTRFKAFVARTGKHSGITATITLPENQGNSNLSCSVRDEVRVKNVSVTRAKNTATRYKEKLYTSASVKTLNLEQTNQQETFQKSAELPRAPLKNSFTRFQDNRNILKASN